MGEYFIQYFACFLTPEYRCKQILSHRKIAEPKGQEYDNIDRNKVPSEFDSTDTQNFQIICFEMGFFLILEPKCQNSVNQVRFLREIFRLCEGKSQGFDLDFLFVIQGRIL